VWLAHEATPDLNLPPDKLEEFARLLADMCREANLTPSQLKDEINKHAPEPDNEDQHEADWWKE
jgi:ABC-type nitrate/sulfonate/bicarbonate transport system substrate-binding protein